jgi:hypothetical protein
LKRNEGYGRRDCTTAHTGNLCSSTACIACGAGSTNLVGEPRLVPSINEEGGLHLIDDLCFRLDVFEFRLLRCLVIDTCDSTGVDEVAYSSRWRLDKSKSEACWAFSVLTSHDADQQIEHHDRAEDDEAGHHNEARHCLGVLPPEKVLVERGAGLAPCTSQKWPEHECQR